MGITFAVRGDSLDARYSSAGKTPGLYYTTLGQAPAVLANAGAIGGSTLNCKSGSIARGLIYAGRENWTSTNSFSVLLRVAPNFSGSPGAGLGLFSADGVGDNQGGRVQWGLNTSGRFGVQIVSELNSALVNQLSPGSGATWSPTAGVFYDLVLTYDGSLTTNALTIFVNAASHIQYNGAATYAGGSEARKRLIQSALGVCFTDQFAVGDFEVNEMVIWDTVIDPTSVALVSGTGSLNGSSRTSFVDVSSFDAHNSTDPGIANVTSGTSYYINGVSYSGTNSVTQSTNPGASNVLLNTNYIINDVTYTGSLVIPTPNSGAAGTVDMNNILEVIQYALEQANTTTASPVDLSSGLSARVRSVYKTHPLKIRRDATEYPFVTCYITEKTMAHTGIAANQLSAKKRAEVTIEVVGAMWNDTFATADEDPADNDIHVLMENVELTLRAYPNLSSAATWQLSNRVQYYDQSIDENTHLRAGIMSLIATVHY